jgi:hypothetical protein
MQWYSLPLDPKEFKIGERSKTNDYAQNRRFRHFHAAPPQKRLRTSISAIDPDPGQRYQDKLVLLSGYDFTQYLLGKFTNTQHKTISRPLGPDIAPPYVRRIALRTMTESRDARETERGGV